MTRPGLGRNAILGSLTTFGGSFGGFLVRFSATAILARILAPEQFGAFALALVDAELVALIGSFSFSQSLLLMKEGRPQLIGTVLRLELLVSLVILLAGLAVYPLVTAGQGQDVADLYLIIVGIMPLTRTSNVLVTELHHRFAYTWIALLQFICVACASVAAVLVADATDSAVALAVKDLGAAVLVLVILTAVHLKRNAAALVGYDRGTARDVVRIGVGLFMNSAAEKVYVRIDSLFVGNMLGNTALGFFNQARYWGGMPGAFVSPIAGVVGMRTMSALADDRVRLSRAFSLVQYVMTRLLMVFAVGAVVAPDLAVRIVLGPGWDQTAYLLRWFAPWIVLAPLAANYKVLLLARQDFRPTVVATVVAALVLAVALPLGIALWDDVGAVGANVIAAGSRLWLLQQACRRHVVVAPATYLPCLIAAALAIGAGAGTRLLVAGDSLWLGAALGLGAAVIVGLLAMIALEGGRLKSELRYIRTTLNSRRASTFSEAAPDDEDAAARKEAHD